MVQDMHQDHSTESKLLTDCRTSCQPACRLSDKYASGSYVQPGTKCDGRNESGQCG